MKVIRSPNINEVWFSFQANRALFYYEENEVSERDSVEDLELHKAVSNELRRVMARIKELKDSGRDDVVSRIKDIHVNYFYSLTESLEDEE